MQYARLSVVIGGVIALLCAMPVLAQELHDDASAVVAAEVVRVISAESRTIAGTQTPHLVQTLDARILDGERRGAVVQIENDVLELTVGQRFFVIRYVTVDGTELWSVQDVDRRATLLVLLCIFFAVIIIFGGWYGMRALASLTGSLFVLIYVLVPGLLSGWQPLPACFAVAALILAGALFTTHGLNRESLIAFGGTLTAVFGTLLTAWWAVDAASITGFSSSESVTVNFNTRGTLDFAGLLIGGILIGALGVLDDIAITQVSVVRELFASTTRLSRNAVFVRAMRVGREHVGAVVNTLALAYVGVSLPLILLAHLSPTPINILLNMELFATELIRTVVGSIGIVLTVPIVTYAAVRFLPRTGQEQMRSSGHVHGRIKSLEN